jgi:alkyl sulfatase BDS1-like metallo-beta-lactamase superfamily hydrolase
MVRGIPLDNLFKAMAVRLNGPAAEDVRLALNLVFPDLGQRYLLTIENAVLHAFEGRQASAANATLTLESLDFKRLMMGLADGATLLTDRRLSVDGDLNALLSLTGLFDQFERRFPIVTPRPPRT